MQSLVAAEGVREARGNVYLVDGGGQRRMVNFPRPLKDYALTVPGNLPREFPDPWVDVDSTAGNSVRAHLGDAGPPIRGKVEHSVLTFDPSDPASTEQMVLNIFYFSGLMHDFFYVHGFRESDGNFQLDNYGRGGERADPVDARAHPGPVWGTANMHTPVDGQSPVMNMGLVRSTRRHTALDSTVVYHEYMHGVTNRLVGGALDVRALDAPQSRGMGEGWGDYIACTLNNSTVVGAWVTGRPGGIRGYAYDSDFPDDFGDLGKGRYTEEHSVGEIWCATLMEMNRQIGSGLGLQLVIDALKLSPGNPSFLDMRDSILEALRLKYAAGQLGEEDFLKARQGVRSAFAKFGMGPAAQSYGASLEGIVTDFSVPNP